MTTGIRSCYSFREMLDTIGISAEDLQAITDTGNYIKEAHISDKYKFVLGPSNVSGLGVACAEEIAAGEVLGIAGSLTHKTMLGRYTNHSHESNCSLEAVDTPVGIVLYLRAKVALPVMRELSLCYVANWRVLGNL
jgi:hypothetical protein